jgi:hypothetical protein
VYASSDAMQNAIEEQAAYIYTEREGENNGVIRCSSCGTNLVSLVFFSLSRLVTDVDAFSLSLPRHIIKQ